MDYKFFKILERYQISVINGMPQRDAYVKSSQELKDADIIDRLSEFKRHIYGHRSYFRPQHLPSTLLKDWQRPTSVTDKDLATFDNNYSRFRHGGQQWAIPECVFESLRELGPIFEVFASPLNRSRHVAKWGSMFDDDKAFGSLGPFQRVPLDEFKDMVVVLNPPYIEYMILLTLSRLDEIKSVAKRVVLCLPGWSDTKWFEQLSQSMFRFDLNSNTYIYHNSMKNEPIVARFDSVLFTDTREALDRCTQPWMEASHRAIFLTAPHMHSTERTGRDHGTGAPVVSPAERTTHGIASSSAAAATAPITSSSTSTMTMHARPHAPLERHHHHGAAAVAAGGTNTRRHTKTTSPGVTGHRRGDRFPARSPSVDVDDRTRTNTFQVLNDLLTDDV